MMFLAIVPIVASILALPLIAANVPGLQRGGRHQTTVAGPGGLAAGVYRIKIDSNGASAIPRAVVLQEQRGTQGSGYRNNY